MNQTNESSFEPDFNHFGPYLGPQFSFFFFFFFKFYLYYMLYLLYIVASYHCM